MCKNIDIPSMFAEVKGFISERLKLGESSMDIEGFLFATGFALLVLLLGWADQITSKSKETQELEDKFLEVTKLKRDDYKKMVREGGTTENSFIAAVDFLYTAEEKNVDVYNKINKIKDDLKKLDAIYGHRFWILLSMSAMLFISGIIAFFLEPSRKLWSLFPNLLFVVAIFLNLIRVHSLEENYTRNIRDVMEKL